MPLYAQYVEFQILEFLAYMFK